MRIGVMLSLFGVLLPLWAENAAPADELAQRKRSRQVAIPEAPPDYRRPADWRANRWPQTLEEIARVHSASMMLSAQKQMAKVRRVNAKGPFKAEGKSLDAHRCPEWFIDAKLGIFIDWGPWSVASWCPYEKGARLYPDWYEHRARVGGNAHAYHIKNWGKDFKSDDLLDLFRGTRFDAPALMKLFRKSGARYVVPFLKHHSGFCLWDCPYTFRDTMDRTAHRDFAREMVEACRVEGLKFGFYMSQCGEWEYPILQADGSIKMLYEAKGPLKPYTPEVEGFCSGKIAVRDFVYDYNVPQATDFIDRYDPDIFWGDYDWVTSAHENGSYDIAAYFYNHAEGRKEVAVNDRYGRAQPAEIEGRFIKYKRSWLRTVRGDFYTDEWGDTEECLDPAKWHPWESCSGISKAYGNHWMENFDPSMVMDEAAFIRHFTDIVARGGNLLLLVNLDAQGAIPAIQRERLEQIGRWIQANAKAIYATRPCAPFLTDTVSYTQSKDGKVRYAIVKKPSEKVLLHQPVGESVTELVSGRKLEVSHTSLQAFVRLPPDLASAKVPFVLCLSPAR